MTTIDQDRARALHHRAGVIADSDAAAATALYEEALAILREQDRPSPALARTLHNLAVLYDRAGDEGRAIALWTEAARAIALWTEAGTVTGRLQVAAGVEACR